jgi:hypothetical protein
VTQSPDNGAETLRLETERCSLEATPAKQGDRWQFNGAVAGTPEDIYATLLPIVQNLEWAGFSAHFEIYDSSFRFVSMCPREGDAP